MKISRAQFVAGFVGLFAGCKSSAAAVVEDDHAKWMDYASGPLDQVASRFMKARLAIAPQMQQVFYGFSGCMRCGLPWPLVPGHTTDYKHNADGGRGVSPLCEDCWDELGVGKFRWPYYEAAWKKWHWEQGMDPGDFELIRKAVMEEKGGGTRGVLLMAERGK